MRPTAQVKNIIARWQQERVIVPNSKKIEYKIPDGKK